VIPAIQLPADALHEIEIHSARAVAVGTPGIAVVVRDLAYTGRILYAQLEAALAAVAEAPRGNCGRAFVDPDHVLRVALAARSEVQPCADT
jgi:hypothetical protein